MQYRQFAKKNKKTMGANVAQAVSAMTLAGEDTTKTKKIDTQPTTNAGTPTTTKQDTAVIKKHQITQSNQEHPISVVNPTEKGTGEKCDTDETGFTKVIQHPSKQNLYIGNLDTLNL